MAPAPDHIRRGKTPAKAFFKGKSKRANADLPLAGPGVQAQRHIAFKVRDDQERPSGWLLILWVERHARRLGGPRSVGVFPLTD